MVLRSDVMLGRVQRRTIIMYAFVLIILLHGQIYASELLYDGTMKLLEENILDSCEITQMNKDNVIVGIPAGKYGNVLVAIYDDQGKFLQVKMNSSEGKSIVDLDMKDKTFEIGYYIKAFFLDSEWRPLAKSSPKTKLLANIEVSNLLLTSGGRLSFYTSVPDASITFNGKATGQVSSMGWNSLLLEEVLSEENEIVLQKEGFQAYSNSVSTITLQNIRIENYPKSIYSQNEPFDFVGLSIKGTWNNTDWVNLPILLTDIYGFTSSKFGEQLVTIRYDNVFTTMNVLIHNTSFTMQTLPGILTVTPPNMIRQSIQTLTLKYITGEIFYNGSLTFVLPEGLTFGLNDSLKGLYIDEVVQIKDILSRAVISDQDRKLTISGLNSGKTSEIEVTLNRRVLPDIGILAFETIGDADGMLDVYSSSETQVTDIELAIGATITGKASLPKGELAPLGGVSLKICAVGISEYFDEIIIAEGESESIYKIVVETGTYKMKFVVPGYSDNRQETFFDQYKNYATDQSEPIVVDENGLELDVQIRELFKVTGEISLPMSEMTPLIDVPVTVGFSWSGDYYYIDSLISKDLKVSSYEILLPKGDFYVSYNLADNQNYVERGYFSTSGTVTNRLADTPITIDRDITEINLELVKGNRVSGKINLPEGFVADKEFSLEIRADSMSWHPYSKVTRTVPVGASSLEYHMYMPNDSYAFSYWLIEEHEAFISHGFYDHGNTVLGDTWNMYFSVNRDIENLNLTLIAGVKVSGSLSLPDGEVAPEGGLEVSISAVGSDSQGSIGTSITIPQGESNIEYTFLVPKGEYSLAYYIQDSLIYVRSGYYSTSGSKYNISEASLVLVENEVSNLAFSLLEGHKISGTVKLPEGEVAPQGGAWIQLSYDNLSNLIESLKVLTIPQGEASTSFEIVVSPNPFRLSYSQSDFSNYSSGCYYSDLGGTTLRYRATIIDPVTQVDPLMLNFVKVFKVSGTIELPESSLALNTDLSVVVAGAHNSEEYTHGVVKIIPAGERKTSFDLTLESGEFRIKYYFRDETQFASNGYYSITGTTLDYNLATLLNGDRDYQNVNLQILNKP